MVALTYNIFLKINPQKLFKMKLRLLFLICFSAFLSVNAQINTNKTQNSSYTNRIQHIFGVIDKTKVTTGYLKEFGVKFANIDACNGSINKANYVNKSHWHALYSSLYSMRVGTAAINMASPHSVNTNLKTQLTKNSEDVIFAAQYYNYQQYKTNAYSNGDVFIVGDCIHDVAGRNPYDIKTLFAVTPLKQRVQGSTFTFKLPSSLIYTNTSLKQIQIDFNDGQGYRTVSVDHTISVSYTSGGEKELKVKFTNTNGKIVYSHSKIWVDYVVSNPDTKARFNGFGTDVIFNALPITGNTWNGSAATGRVTVELAPGHSQLTKPLIVIEGFDPENSFDYFDLVTNPNNFGPGSLNVIIDPTTGLTLNQAIEDEDYDLVFVNFENSTDFIQRNAFMVEEVIRWVNNQKVGIEKNAVLGMSMGGLVGRYALRNMELNGETHETKLYISHDSPHQGANVPLAAQALLRHLIGEEIALPVFFSLFDINVFGLENNFPELTEGLTLLQSPAAQQMLIYQLQGTGNDVTINNTNLHNDFLNEYQNMGYPQQDNIRNIAISNGTECGSPLDFDAYDQIANVNLNVDLPFFITNLALTLVNGLSINPLKVLSSILSTDTDIKAQFELRALPSLQSRQIYNGQIYIEKTILFLIDVREPLIDKESLNSGSNMLALDNANGGIFDIENFADLPDGFEEFVLQSRFNFIPIYSSLDVGSGNGTITPNDLIEIYNPLSPPSAPKDIPFDNFFTNPTNGETHIQFTLNNGNWLISELADMPEVSSCAFVCEGAQIAGNNVLCASNQYSVQAAIPTDAEVTWSVNNINAVSLSNSTGISTTLSTPPNSYRTNVVLTATITSVICQGTVSVTKTIWVGKPGTPAYLNGPTTVNTGALVSYSAGISEGASSYKWWLPYPFDVSNPIDYFAQNWQMTPTNHRNLTAMTGYGRNSGYVQVMGVNECGCGGAQILNVQHGNGGDDPRGGGGIPKLPSQDDDVFNESSKYFKIYPNPSKDIINISLDVTEKVETIQIYNLQGRLVKEWNTQEIEETSFQLDLSKLNSGMYMLRINDTHIEKITKL